MAGLSAASGGRHGPVYGLGGSEVCSTFAECRPFVFRQSLLHKNAFGIAICLGRKKKNKNKKTRVILLAKRSELDIRAKLFSSHVLQLQMSSFILMLASSTGRHYAASADVSII